MKQVSLIALKRRMQRFLRSKGMYMVAVGGHGGPRVRGLKGNFCTTYSIWEGDVRIEKCVYLIDFAKKIGALTDDESVGDNGKR